jgi:hypothetical protein
MQDEESASDEGSDASSTQSNLGQSSLQSLLRPDESAVLEHVVRVGSFWRQEVFREKAAWAMMESGLGELSSGPIKSSSKKRRPTNEDYRLHAQDTRIYATKTGFENDAWPKAQKKIRPEESQTRSDIQWDLDLSDGIHPVAFSFNRLSAAQTAPTEALRYSSLELAFNAGSVSISSRDDAYKAFLYRAWDRAVHAVSLTVASNGAKSLTFSPQRLSVFLARDRCKKLGIQLEDPTSISAQDRSAIPNTCPGCTATFPSASLLERHFYGKKGTRGCCWKSRIAQEDRVILDRVLDQEVQAQLGQLLSLLVSQAKAVVKQQQDARTLKREPGVLNWGHVLGMLQTTLASSRKCRQDTTSSEVKEDYGCILETLEIDRSGFPLLINQAMLDSVKKTLISRYGGK